MYEYYHYKKVWHKKMWMGIGFAAYKNPSLTQNKYLLLLLRKLSMFNINVITYDVEYLLYVLYVLTIYYM